MQVVCQSAQYSGTASAPIVHQRWDNLTSLDHVCGLLVHHLGPSCGAPPSAAVLETRLGQDCRDLGTASGTIRAVAIFVCC